MVITTPIVAGTLVVTGAATTPTIYVPRSDNHTRAPRGPTQSTAVRSTLKQHPPHPETGPGDAHEMRLKEPTPPGYFCARMRRPLRFRNRTPSATSRRSSRRGLRRETEQSAGRTSEGVTLNAAYRRPIGANFRQAHLGAARQTFHIRPWPQLLTAVRRFIDILPERRTARAG